MNILTCRILIFVFLNFLLFVKGDKVIWTAGGYTLYQNLDTVKVNDIVAPNYIAKNAKSVSLTGGGFVTVWTNSTSGRIISQIFNNKGEPVNHAATLYESETANLNLDVSTFPNDTYGVTWNGGGINGTLTYIEMFQYNVSGYAVWEDIFGSVAVNFTDPHCIFWNDVYLVSYTAPDGVYIYENDKGKFNISKVSDDINGTAWSYKSQIVLRGDFYSVVWSRTSTSGPKNFELYFANYKGNGNQVAGNLLVSTIPSDIDWHAAALSNNELALAWIDSPKELFVQVWENQEPTGQFSDTLDVNDVSILPVLDGFFLLLVGNKNNQNQTYARYLQNSNSLPIGPYFTVGDSDTNRPTGAVFSNPQNANFSISWTNYGQYNTNYVKNKNLFYSTYSLAKDTKISQIKS